MWTKTEIINGYSPRNIWPSKITEYLSHCTWLVHVCKISLEILYPNHPIEFHVQKLVVHSDLFFNLQANQKELCQIFVLSKNTLRFKAKLGTNKYSLLSILNTSDNTCLFSLSIIYVRYVGHKCQCVLWRCHTFSFSILILSFFFKKYFFKKHFWSDDDFLKREITRCLKTILYEV